MGVKSKVTEHDREQAVKKYASKEASVASLAKLYKVSVPAVYQWITAAKEANSRAVIARSKVGLGSDGSAVEVNSDLRVKQLEQQNDILKRRLLDLMSKYNEW